LRSLDINGSPKIMPRDVIAVMDLKSTGWLLDPEMMIKAHYMGVRILEFNVFARMRGSGVSHVSAGALWEFISALLHYRFSLRRSQWKEKLEKDVCRKQVLRHDGDGESYATS
jgi:hypothetical protein